jgi:hypothetical protein
MYYKVIQLSGRDPETWKPVYITLAIVPDYMQAINICKAHNNSYVIDLRKNIMFSNMDLPFSTVTAKSETEEK